MKKFLDKQIRRAKRRRVVGNRVKGPGFVIRDKALREINLGRVEVYETCWPMRRTREVWIEHDRCYVCDRSESEMERV